MRPSDGAMQVILLITAGVVLGMLVTLVVQRIVRHRRELRRAELDQRIRPLVLTATVVEDDEVDALLEQVRTLPAAERAHVRRTVFHMLRDVTGEAADRLRAVGDAAGLVPRIFAATGHRAPSTRADAAEALGLVRPPGALDALCVLAVDPVPEVRTVAIRALGSFTEPEAIDLVVGALATESGVPGSVAASALLQQGGAASDRVRRALDDPDAGVRHGAARVAGLLQAPGAAEVLARLVDDPSEPVRLAAIRSLERLPASSAVPSLLRTALSDDPAGEAAAATLAAMPAVWAGDALAQLDAQGGAAVRRAAGLRRQDAA
ncbi:HEAT repeat domain-containing protein [Agrococcus carbonis]|nr:HEAT repeat domain-containing protein [Agrococcus carbonis]